MVYVSNYHHLTKPSLFFFFINSSKTKLLIHYKTLPISPFSSIPQPAKTPTNPFTKTPTFSYLYQLCSLQKSLNQGKQAHAHMILSGFIPTVFVSNCLIQLYVKCSRMEYAQKVFDEMGERDVVSYNAMITGYSGIGQMGIARDLFDGMLERDVVSWNSLISGYVQNGECEKACGVFVEMRRFGARFDRTTFAVVFKLCAVVEELCLGVQVHGLVVQMGYNYDVYTGSALVDMYAKCKRLTESFLAFDELPEKNWVSWSAMIAGCAQNDQYIKGVMLFKEMLKLGIGVSQSIYASVFRSSAGLSAHKLGTQLHCHSLKSNFGSDVIVGTATLDMYAKCGNVEDAQKLFNSLPKRSLQSYNAMIVGRTQCEQGTEALSLFCLLLRSGLGFDEISLSSASCSCALIKGKLEGLQVHGLAIKSTFIQNTCVANAVLDMYGKCGALLEASRIFHEMEKRDAVSWNAIIAAHEQNWHEEETLSLFTSMLYSRMEPDEFTYGSVLKACADQQALNTGMEIHGRILKTGMALHSFVGGALVDMYSKCGIMEEAEKIHDRTEEQTMVSWNAIIAGYVLLKQSEDAQRFFSQMLEMGVKPDNFTYATILDTCANLASVGLGKQIHAQIIKQELQSDVYICSTLVDMYSKCGNMQDSRQMFEKAPKKDFITWNAMICGYAHHGYGEEALHIFETMRSHGIMPNHATFVSVLRACAHMGLADKGVHYFDVMISEYGLDPQPEHYSCMVDIIGRAGRVGDALKLIQDMPFEADAVVWRTLLGVCKIHGNVEIAEYATKSILLLDPLDSSAYILLSNIYADAGMWSKVSEMRKNMRYNKLKKEPGCSWIEVKDEVHTFLVRDKDHPQYEEILEKLTLLICEMKPAGCTQEVDIILQEDTEEDDQVEELKVCGTTTS